MHIKDNLVTLDFETKDEARAFCSFAWELKRLFESFEDYEGITFTPEKAMLNLLQQSAIFVHDAMDNPIPDA